MEEPTVPAAPTIEIFVGEEVDIVEMGFLGEVIAVVECLLMIGEGLLDL